MGALLAIFLSLLLAYTENRAGSYGKSGRSFLGDGVFWEFDL